MLIVNFQKIKEMKKIDKNKISDVIAKPSHPKIEQIKHNDKLNSLEVNELKFELTNVENQLLTPSTEIFDKKLNKFEILKKREDIEHELSKIIKKIGNQRKKPLSPKRQLEIELSLNRINIIREKIKNNAEFKLQKYSIIKKKIEIHDEKNNEISNFNDFLKIESLNFNIIKTKNPIENEKELNDLVNNQDKTNENKLINTKTLVMPLNPNTNISIFNKINISNKQNLIINEINKKKNDQYGSKKIKIHIENRENEMSPVNRFKIKHELNLSPSKQMVLEKHHQTKYLQYVIRKGNNYDLMKKCFMLRSNWKELSVPGSTNYNYKWQETKRKIEYVLLNKNVLNSNLTKMVNHFEYDPEISNKKYMFINFLLYCDKNNLNVFDFVPLTVIMKYNSPNFPKNLKNFSFLYKNIQNFFPDAVRCDNNKYSDYFIIDGFESPKNTSIYIEKTHFKDKNLWILKPTDLCGGRCIYVSSNLDEIEKLIKNFFDGMVKSLKKNVEANDPSDSDESSEELDEQKLRKYRTSTIILQKYIEDPFLYKGRKFDIRMWALIDQNMQIYLFREGHLKTASVAYDLSKNDKFVHITNYSLQKLNNNFNKHEHGNELSFKDFQEFLNIEHKDKGIDFKKHLYPKMIEIIKLTTDSVKEKINRKNRKFCYVVLGYDFMIDINFKIWLIEINKNPGLSFSSPIIEMLLPRMMDDSFRLTVDKIFDPIYVNNDQNKYKSPYSVEGYDDYENMW